MKPDPGPKGFPPGVPSPPRTRAGGTPERPMPRIPVIDQEPQTTSTFPGQGPDADQLRCWLHAVQITGAVRPGQGLMVALELTHRGAEDGAVPGAIAAAIWKRVGIEFGGTLGIAAVDARRAAIALPSEDEALWASIAGSALEAAGAAGLAPRDLGVGIGLAAFEDREQSTGDVLRVALEGARVAGRSGIGCERRSVADRAREMRAGTLRSSLRAALDGDLDGLRVIFQPKVDAISGAISGAEALLRFRCPEIGDVSAIELLSVAEASGELERIDRWVLGLAVERQSLLEASGVDPVPISVNVRGKTAFTPGFTECVTGMLEAFGVDAKHLEIELREADVLDCPILAEHVIASLRDAGVAVALDEFGRDSARTVDLRRLRVSTVKLDRGLVRELNSGPGGGRVAVGLLRLAKAFGVETVAVGIEDDGQAIALRAAGCDALQGYLFFRPMEAEDFVDRIATGSRTMVSA